MAHDHASAAARHRTRLLAVLALTGAFAGVEVTAGILTGSLVLLADAGHMLTDVGGLSLALLAIWFAQRPANDRMTYGYYRAEILGALANAALLFAVAAYIFYESIRRMQDPGDVPAMPLLVVASLGLCVNLTGMRLLLTGARESLNVRGAFLELGADLLGSVGAIVTGVIILTTGWRYADPLIAIAVAIAILPRTWHLLRSALDVLFEGTPPHIRLPDVQRAILEVDGVQAVHDLHVWTVTSGFVALSGHVAVPEHVDRDRTLVALRSTLHDRFEIEHVTIQIEDEGVAAQLDQPCLPGQSPCYADELPVRRNIVA